MYPIDLLKVRILLAELGSSTHGTQTRMQVVNPSPGAIYTGLSNAVSTISRIEGFGSFWRGVTSVIVGAGTSWSRASGHECS